MGSIDMSGMGDAGTVETRTYDSEMVSQIQNDQAKEASDQRYLRIPVPPNIPEEVLRAAWQIGMSAVQRVNRSMLFLVFPSITKGEDGQDYRAIGSMEVILTREEDIQRVIELCTAINEANVKLIEASKSGRPSDMAAAILGGNKVKDAALEQAKSGVSNGIITP